MPIIINVAINITRRKLANPGSFLANLRIAEKVNINPSSCQRLSAFYRYQIHYSRDSFLFVQILMKRPFISVPDFTFQ